MNLMQILREKALKNTVIWFFTIQLLNLSIDPYDQFHAQKDFVVNEVESIIEMVLEIFLDQGNVITEADEDDSINSKTPPYSWIVEEQKHCALIDNTPAIEIEQSGFYFIHYKSICQYKFTPPPKLA